MANPLIRKTKRNKTIPMPNQSAGILDDFAIRKTMATKQGTIEHVPTNDSDIANKKYVDDKFPVTHTSTTGQTTDDHHAQLHDLSSHSDLDAGNKITNVTDPTADQDAVWTKVILDTENYDVLGEFDSTTNYRFTATNSGYYQVNGGIRFNAPGDGEQIAVAVAKNGTGIAIGAITCAGINPSGQTVSDIIYLNGTTDYIELQVFQNVGGGGTKALTTGSQFTFLSIHKLS